MVLLLVSTFEYASRFRGLPFSLCMSTSLIRLDIEGSDTRGGDERSIFTKGVSRVS